MILTRRPRETSDEGRRAARVSMGFLWWLPISPIVGFVLANRFLSESWPLWQVLPLAVILAAPFAVGARFGWKAARLGEARGWVGLALHLVLGAIALVMPIYQALI